MFRALWYGFVTFLGLSSPKANDEPVGCPTIRSDGGLVECVTYENHSACLIQCDGEQPHVFVCTPKGYFPGKLPKCVEQESPNAPSSCSGLSVTDGSVSCSSYGQNQNCLVTCRGEPTKRVTCTPENGWSKNMPKCAKPIGNTDRYEDEACDKKCDKLCGMSHLSGRCKNDSMTSCECY